MNNVRDDGIEGVPGSRWGAGAYIGPRRELRLMRAILHETGDVEHVEAQFHGCHEHGGHIHCEDSCLTHGWHPFLACDFEVDYWKKVFPVRSEP